MTRTERVFLWIALGWGVLHLLRDLVQDAQWNHWFATFASKPECPPNVYSYILESIVIVLSLLAVSEGRFRGAGAVAVATTFISWAAWAVYWFVY